MRNKKIALTVAAAALIAVWVAVFTFNQHQAKTDAASAAASAVPWKEFGNELLEKASMNVGVSCNSLSCKKDRYLASQFITQNLDGLPDGQTKDTLQTAALDYQDSYGRYMAECDYTLDRVEMTFECGTLEYELDGQGVTLSKIASLLASDGDLSAL